MSSGLSAATISVARMRFSYSIGGVKAGCASAVRARTIAPDAQHAGAKAITSDPCNLFPSLPSTAVVVRAINPPKDSSSLMGIDAAIAIS